MNAPHHLPDAELCEAEHEQAELAESLVRRPERRVPPAGGFAIAIVLGFPLWLAIGLILQAFA